MWAAGLLLIPVVALFAAGGLGLAVFIAQRDGEVAVQPPQPQPPPPSQPPTETPKPALSTASVVQVQFESEPSGAEVWEQDRQLCTATPCMVEHPDYAPPVRNFVLKLESHPDTSYQMTDPTIIQRVELSKPKTARPRPKPGGNDLLPTR